MNEDRIHKLKTEMKRKKIFKKKKYFANKLSVCLMSFLIATPRPQDEPTLNSARSELLCFAEKRQRF